MQQMENVHETIGTRLKCSDEKIRTLQKEVLRSIMRVDNV